jgi:UDP-N-acetylmuramyl tripeptide synthase
MHSYGAAKSRLFAWPGLQAAVINLDDAYGRELIGQLPRDVRAVGVSSRGDDAAALRAQALQFDNAGIAFDLLFDGNETSHPVHSPLLGRFNVDNLLAVGGALLAQGIAPSADRAHTVATAAHPRPHEPPRRRRLAAAGGHRLRTHARRAGTGPDLAALARQGPA